MDSITLTDTCNLGAMFDALPADSNPADVAAVLADFPAVEVKIYRDEFGRCKALGADEATCRLFAEIAQDSALRGGGA